MKPLDPTRALALLVGLRVDRAPGAQIFRGKLDGIEYSVVICTGREADHLVRVAQKRLKLVDRDPQWVEIDTSELSAGENTSEGSGQ
jgi:hypothetical protein